MRHRFNIGIPIDNAVKLYMPLWAYGKENGSVMLDHSQNHIDGVINGALPSQLGWNFDGDDYINLGNNLGFEYTDKFSAIGWVRRNVASVSHVLVGKSATSNVGWWLVISSGNKTSAWLSSLSGNINKQGASLITNLDRFFCVGFTYDGSNSPNGIKIYVNGVDDNGTPSGTSTGGSILNTTNCTIGARNGGISALLNGKLGEVVVFLRELSAQEMQNYYNITRKRYRV